MIDLKDLHAVTLHDIIGHPEFSARAVMVVGFEWQDDEPCVISQFEFGRIIDGRAFPSYRYYRKAMGQDDEATQQQWDDGVPCITFSSMSAQRGS